MTDPVDAWVKEKTPGQLANDWVARSLAKDGDDITGCALDLATAAVYATLAVADALAGVQRELGYVAECIVGDGHGD